MITLPKHRRGFKLSRAQSLKGFKTSRAQSLKGFTLIELLIVVSIIALLATLGLINYQEAQKNARNNKRKADLKAVQAALETYYIDNRRYPSGGSSGTVACNFGPAGPTYIQDSQTLPAVAVQLTPAYIQRLPSDPSCNRPSASQYQYIPSATGYTLRATLGNDCPGNGVPATDEFRSTLANPTGQCFYDIRR